MAVLVSAHLFCLLQYCRCCDNGQKYIKVRVVRVLSGLIWSALRDFLTRRSDYPVITGAYKSWLFLNWDLCMVMDEQRGNFFYKEVSIMQFKGPTIFRICRI